MSLFFEAILKNDCCKNEVWLPEVQEAEHQVFT